MTYESTFVSLLGAAGSLAWTQDGNNLTGSLPTLSDTPAQHPEDRASAAARGPGE